MISTEMSSHRQKGGNYDSMLDNLMDSINSYMNKENIQNVDGRKSSEKPEKKNKNEKSLEMRLAGTREALKTVEKELKERNSQVKQLVSELQKKQKIVDYHESNCNKAQPNYNSSSEVTLSEWKRREKEWEKKFQENDNQLKEQRKYMQRLQELNQQLLLKIK